MHKLDTIRNEQRDRVAADQSIAKKNAGRGGGEKRNKEEQVVWLRNKTEPVVRRGGLE